jgi:hypothetical protein
MGVYKFSQAGTLVQPRTLYKSMLAGNEPFIPPAYELIESTILTGSQASVSFINLDTYASTYKHLQVRYVTKMTLEGSADLYFKLNGSSTGYSWHRLSGGSTSVAGQGFATRTSIQIRQLSDVGNANSNQNAFTAGVIDLLDPYSTAKNKTIRVLHGLQDNDLGISLTSGLWANTNSLTSMEFSLFSGSFGARTRFSLYGIKG